MSGWPAGLKKRASHSLKAEDACPQALSACWSVASCSAVISSRAAPSFHPRTVQPVPYPAPKITGTASSSHGSALSSVTFLAQPKTLTPRLP